MTHENDDSKQIKWQELKMTEIFYFFLLNVLFWSGNHNVQAQLLNPRSLDPIEFEIYSSEWNGIENLNLYKNPQKRNANEFSLKEIKYGEKEPRVKREFAFYEGMKKPFASFDLYNFQKQPFPSNNFGIVETTFDQDKSPDKYECSDKVFPKTATRWRNEKELDDFHSLKHKFREKLRDGVKQKKEIPTGFRLKPRFRKVRRYLDYTNSQMPFNEGKAKHNSDQDKNKLTGAKLVEKNDSDNPKQMKSLKEIEKSNLKRHLEDIVRFKKETLSVPMDDPFLEYSRVRRFLDYEKAKKRSKPMYTLEVKEAAMSRILDPNLNLDGILEPHVRKRRGRYALRRLLNSRLKRWTGVKQRFFIN